MSTVNNPVDYWNFQQNWQESFNNNPAIQFKKNEITLTEKEIVTTATVENGCLSVPVDILGIKKGTRYTPFSILTHFKFNGDYKAAIAHIEYYLFNNEIPYMRVGTDYIKVISKVDQYGIERKILKGWRKDEIKQDHGAPFLKLIHRFDDWCISPDNTNHSIIVNNCYNMYAPFSHTPHPAPVTKADIPFSMAVLNQIFGEQIALGLKYLKVIYEKPTQILPVLCLVSEKRQTGKTTFLNWMQMIFGDNYVQINPEDMTSSFNSTYAAKNIIAIDETVIDKSHAVEKIKALSTSKSISVNQKFVANYSLPFFGKLILCTNKEKDFMRIDQEEVRFWIRKTQVITNRTTNAEELLRAEIPKLLRFISELPPIDYSKSRMVFTEDELSNVNLEVIKKESWSGLRKELVMNICEHFNENPSMESFMATAIDIKKKWFQSNNQISAPYIFKVVTDEMGLPVQLMRRYVYFGVDPLITKPGRPFIFNRSDYEEFVGKVSEENEIPF